MQLVAYGAQDVYLTGNPQITFFKVVYRRHTNFSMESIKQTWNGSSLADGRCTATISRNGDLVHRMYIEVGGPQLSAASDNPGAAWIRSVELEIGGQKIDKQSGTWMEAWTELTMGKQGATVLADTDTQNSAATGTNAAGNAANGGNLLHLTTGMCGVSRNGGGDGVIGGADGIGAYYHVPLYFWFCRNPGLALPLIALQYHEVKVILDHQINSVFAVGAANTPSVNNLWCDYIYLDTDERRRFAQVSHEYLIEQVQESALLAQTVNTLNFNHPVKELIITRSAGGLGRADLLLPTNLGAAAASVGGSTMTLKLNGHERFAPRHISYFSRTQVLQHHSGFGGLDSNGAARGCVSNDSILVYSFALKPEEHQPSGTCNFSRIDTAELVTTNNFNANAICYAVNYNVLRIMSGMGGLAYSN